jgi:hypothetical protein
LSRADKTQTEITYDLVLDAQNQTLESLEVTILCAMRDRGAGVAAQSAPGALSSVEHVAFKLRYEFSRQNAVDRFQVPAEAAKLLR